MRWKEEERGESMKEKQEPTRSASHVRDAKKYWLSETDLMQKECGEEI